MRQATLDSWKFSYCDEVGASEVALKMRISSFLEFRENLNFQVLLASEVRAGNLGPSTIAWSSYSAAMVSMSSYEIDKEKLRLSFQCKSP